MPLLFPRNQNEEFVGTADAATRRLSLMSLETDFVAGVYGKMASVYDVFFGLPLHHGRATAIRRMGIRPDDQILEVGVGTGMSLPLYLGVSLIGGLLLVWLGARVAEAKYAKKFPKVYLFFSCHPASMNLRAGLSAEEQKQSS